MKSNPVTIEEMRRVDENLPMAYGTFRASKSTCVKEIPIVFCEEVKATRFYKILPRKVKFGLSIQELDCSCTYSDFRGNSQYLQIEVVSNYIGKASITVAA